VIAMPTRADAVLADVLERHASERPEQPFALFEDGRALTFGELATRTWTIAHALRRRVGIGEGEIVPAWLPNGEEALLAWFAANAAGCVFAPLNTAYRGRLPAHALAARARRPGRRVGSRGGRHRAAAGPVLMSRWRGCGSPWPTTSATHSSRRTSGPE
jgi:acyl-CoA synthetase (AMP-forming)/AMP-acid ligase II